MLRHASMVLIAVVLAARGTAVAAADPERFTARVVSIHDGDCVTVLDADRNYGSRASTRQN